MKVERHQGDREHHGKGHHILEKMCLPNGEYASVLIWHVNNEDRGD